MPRKREVPPRSSRSCTVELLPLVAGMHELKGIMVEDMHTKKKYIQDKLLDLYVVHTEEDGNRQSGGGGSTMTESASG